MRHSIPKGIIIQGLLGDDICQAFPMVFDGAGLTVGLINMGLIHRAGHTSIPSMIFTIKSSPICLVNQKMRKRSSNELERTNFCSKQKRSMSGGGYTADMAIFQRVVNSSGEK